jgi:predicted nucleotidyltransferase
MDDGLSVAALIEYLSAQEDVLAAYLFGSHATGKARPGSDVDVAVLLSQKDSLVRFERRLRLGNEAEDAIGRPVDLIVLNDAPPLLQHQVLKHGRLLDERDQRARVEFEVRAGQVYADLEPMRKFFQQALFREIEEVGLGGRR